MIDLELLKELHRRIHESILATAPGNEQLIFAGINVYAKQIEHPQFCFWMLDELEDAGFIPGVRRSNNEDQLTYFAFEYYKHYGYASGDTRTEAVARLFVAVKPVLEGK